MGGLDQQQPHYTRSSTAANGKKAARLSILCRSSPMSALCSLMHSLGSSCFVSRSAVFSSALVSLWFHLPRYDLGEGQSKFHIQHLSLFSSFLPPVAVLFSWSSLSGSACGSLLFVNISGPSGYTVADTISKSSDGRTSKIFARNNIFTQGARPIARAAKRRKTVQILAL